MADLLMADLIIRRADRVVRRPPGFGGGAGAILAFCLSLTPSLLPRHWALQGVLSGLTMALGYGAGAAVGAVARGLRPGLPAPPRRAWAVLAGAGAGLAVVSLWAGESWQREVRRLTGAPPAAGWDPALIAVVAVAVCGLLVLAARTVRLATRRLSIVLGRFSPRPVASVAAVAIVATAGYGVGQGVVFTAFVDTADRVAAAADGTTAPGVARPESPYLSGGPGSLVPWDTLGAHGRRFTAGAVPRSRLAEFSGTGATAPIRVYVGRDSAPALAAQAELAVRELARTGAFDRAVLAIVVTTGTGWVNPVVADALEYLYAGDSALVAMQYSHLPSWVSFLADRSSASEAAAALLGAVRRRLATVPAGQRPALLVYGESLGAYGVETAFGSLSALLAGTDGTLLAGPPHRNPIWREVVDGRRAASPMWRPVYGGGDRVRFAQRAADLDPAGRRPELVYLQNASDPVVWWSPELLFREPEWLAGDHGPDVSGAVRWYPVVTFWQVTADLLSATSAPAGHGHSYGGTVAAAWAAMAPPPGWTGADTARLRALLAQQPPG